MATNPSVKRDCGTGVVGFLHRFAPQPLTFNVMRLKTSLRNLLWFLLATVLIAGCSQSSRAPQAFTVPLPDDILQITVSVRGKEQSKRIVQNRAAIEHAIRLVSENKSNGSKTQFTFPTPSASAVFSTANGSAPLVIWFGPDWLGVAATVGGERGNYFWHIPTEVEVELRGLLEIRP
jgi:hypothetical protein